MVVAAAAFGDQLAYAVEISHTNRKVAGKSDYIYLITQSETVQLRWCAAFPSRPAGPWIPVHWTWLTVRLILQCTRYHALLKICEPYESIAEKPQSRVPVPAHSVSCVVCVVRASCV